MVPLSPYGTASDVTLTSIGTCLFKIQDSAPYFQDTEKPIILLPHCFLPILYDHLHQLFYIVTHLQHILTPLGMVLRINLKVTFPPSYVILLHAPGGTQFLHPHLLLHHLLVLIQSMTLHPLQVTPLKSVSFLTNPFSFLLAVTLCSHTLSFFPKHYEASFFIFFSPFVSDTM
jgi:hypothetical protein